MSRRWARVVLPLAAAALTFALAAAAVPAQQPSKRLSKEEAQLVAKARQQGDKTIMVMFSTAPGQARTVVAGLESLGASVRYRDDQLGYVRAKVPTDKIEAAFALAGVDGYEIDRVIPLPDPRPEGVSAVTPYPAPSAATPRSNPYMPTADIGAAQFVDAHPTWDGRGTKIGIVDTGVSLDHPSLLTTSTGARKVVEWVTGTHPTDDNDPTWVNMAAQVSGSTFSFGDPARTYTAPAAGTYRIGLFNERDPRLGGELGNDVNRDGNPAGSSGIFAVLWHTDTDRVWVDTNQNGSFADQQAMRNYSVAFDVGYFGTDNPATAIAERIPFVIQTDGSVAMEEDGKKISGKFVNIGIVSGFHGSHVAGIAAGNDLYGSTADGAAPGAQIVSSRACLFVAGCTNHALLEGMIHVAKQEDVDVINMSIGGLPALNDGNNARCRIYQRLIEQSNVQMFFSAGNSGPGMNVAGDPGLCTDVMGMGAYITSATYLADYGTEMPFADNLHYFSSRGPREDGGLSPKVVAPGAAVSTTPMWQPGSGLPYNLPPGYQLANGTSMASPQAAGVGALLISAADQTGVQHQPAQIRKALLSTARLLDTTRFGTYEQGLGLINVGAAWNLLDDNLGTVTITSSVAVNSILNGFLATPGKGEGIYDREGVTVGSAYSRTYTFTRHDGPGGSKTYNVVWIGNDGTFSSAGTVALARGGSAEFVVNINPATPGAHSAILALDDPTSPGIEYATSNVVVAAHEFTAGNNYSVTVTGSIPRGQTHRYFFRVPAGTPAFKVDMTGGGATAGAGAIRFLRWHPWGLGVDSNAVSNCYNGAPGGCSTGSPTSRTVANPQAGVWEVTVDARRNSDAFAGAPYTLTASILGASVSPNPDVIASATVGAGVSRTYTLTNLFGAFTGRAVGTNMGSAKIATPTIANHAVQPYDVTVPAGATSLRATIGSPSDPAADLDLFVFNCTSGTCVQAGSNADGDSEESVTIANPAAGLWRVVVDGFSVPSGSTTYKYIDVFHTTTPMGTIAVTDANALRPAGATWTVPAVVTANAVPAAGRVLYGNVEVRTDQNVLVGSGDVVVQSVN